jgi:predicted extracellular nuclease/uncharacterized protein YjiK/2',3'-cyclic-nucleotide 2'-phosphodiesterase (5'-nucleotidase family)
MGKLYFAADGASNQAGTDARLDQYTQFNAPNVSGYAAYQAELAKRKIYLDDGSSTQNLDPILFGRGGNPLSATNTLRSGDTVASITGILDERFEGYRIQTTAPVNFIASNPRPVTPPVVGGTLKVASFNVLNYFNDLDTNPGSNNGPNITTPNGLTFEPRGANTSTEFTRQRDKIIQVIVTSGADVMGLMELENNGFGSTSAIQDLVNGLNAVAGAGTYTFINPGTSISTDAITVGIIYKPSKVTPVGAAATMPNDYGSGAFDLVGRKPLAQTFAQSSNGATFTVVVNHFKSKSSSAGAIGDADAGDGQGLSNGTRTRQAQDLATWLATKPTGVNDADYLLLGDFNAYSKEDPITTLASNGYSNLLPNTSYSYVFDGQVGSLDHALATSTLASQVIGADKWHINADEPAVLDYNTDFKSTNQVTSLYNSDPYRASDHDPVVVGLNLGVNLTGVDLSNYVRIGRYNLPEPSRDTAPTGSVLAQETSAVTYNWDTDTLFVVGDGNTSIVQVSKTGQLIDSMTLTPASAQDSTTGFYDTEGLTYIGGGKFVLIEERDRRANLFTYVPNTTLTRDNVQTVKLGATLTTPDSGNVGIEGISYDPITGGYIAVKEISPSGIFQTGIDFAAGTATNGSATTVNSTNLFDPALAGLGDFSDVYALSNQPTLNGQSQYNNLLILSQESGKIVNSDRSGNISSSLTIVSDPNNPLSVPNQQFEGLTMDRNGLLYVTSENGGGDINHPQVWIYAPSSYNYTNQAPLSVSFNVINSSLVENTNTTNRVKLANIIISDDAKGTNNLTLAGADASAFEINSSTSVPELFLKAGTSLNSTTKGSYNVTVNVDDPTVGSVVDATRNFTLSVTPAPTLVISEVAPWSSGNSAVAADWFEVTNVSANAINITGWKMDDNSNSFASAVSLSGITSIAAGESVIFIESTTASPAATVIQNFKNTWFGGNTPTNLQIGTYQGSGVGLGSGGDAVNLYDGSGNLKANVTFGSSPGASPFATFDNSAGASSVSTLSVAGVKGAYSVTDTTSTQIGSPGKTANYQLQLLHYYGESGLLSVQTAPIMGALIDKFDDQYTNTLILGEGDSYIPGPWLVGGADPSLNGVPGIGSTALGRPDIAIMNAFGTNASALGNHEFDLGSPVLQSAIQASGTWVGAQFPLITANLDFSADSSLRSLADKTLGGTSTNNFAGQEASSIKGKIAPYAVVTKSGEKIGLVGATTYDLLSKSSPNGTVPKDDNNPSTSDLQEVAAYIQGSVDALKAMGINKIIMVDQLDTLDRNKALAPLVSGIDVMVAGGGHERMGDATDIAVGFNGHTADFISDAYPIVTAGADGKPTLIVTTDTEYTYLGRLVVDFDGNGNIVVPNLNPAINGAYASTVATLQTAYNTTNSASQIIASSTIGSQVQAITTAINNVVSSKDGTVWGYTNVYLEGDRAFGRVQEVNLGDITADANLYAARQALGNGVFLTSLKNGGGLRASIGSIDENGNKIAPIANPAASKAAGAISTLDIENALRFDNKLMVFDTTPQGLKNILEFAAGLSSNLSQQSGGYMQIGGIRVSYDPSSASGSKVKSIALTNAAGNVIQAIYGNGSFFASAPSTISMVCLNFTANGGDSYPIKANATNFRYLLTDGTLSAPINSSLDFTAAANVPVNALGEQKSFQTYLQAFHSTPTTAYNVADTGAAQDQRIQILSLRSDTVLQVPTDIGLSSTTIAENSSNGTVLGTLTATDSGGADTTNFIFSLNSNAGGRFAINGSQLVVANGSLLDYETNTSHQVSIRVTDASGAFYDKNFTIGVLDRAVFTINDVTVGEAAGTANFTVTTIDPIATGTATVNYATANGTAFASPYDYIATSGTLTFTGGGATTQTIAVTINNDSIYEPVNETFSVNLSNAINGTIADAQGICTIQDDDLPVTVRVTDASIPEGNSGTKNLNFLISLSAPSGQVVTVDYATANNTATAGSDYTSTSGSLTIQPGATSGVVSVPILGDTTAELDETFFLNLTNATGGVTIARGQAIGTIINDDGVGGLVLTGTSGPDTLTGSTTNDTLTGLAGADILDGQGGADTFVYTALTDSLLGGRDSLRSFNPGEGDRIKLPNRSHRRLLWGQCGRLHQCPCRQQRLCRSGGGGLSRPWSGVFCHRLWTHPAPLPVGQRWHRRL